MTSKSTGLAHGCSVWEWVIAQKHLKKNEFHQQLWETPGRKGGDLHGAVRKARVSGELVSGMNPSTWSTQSCIPSFLALAGFPFIGSHTSSHPFTSWLYNLYLPSSLLSHLLLRSLQSGSNKNVLWSKQPFSLHALVLEKTLCNNSQAVPICELSRDCTCPPSAPVPLDRSLPKEGQCFEDSLSPQYPVNQHGDSLHRLLWSLNETAQCLAHSKCCLNISCHCYLLLLSTG